MNYQVGDYVRYFSFIGRIISIETFALSNNRSYELLQLIFSGPQYVTAYDHEVRLIASKDNHLAKLLK